jgi:1-acyl-sn-glycerol-3-phosphate acyltransferase
MTDRKQKPASPPGAPNAPEPDASERLLQAEGADVPQRQRPAERRRRRRRLRAERAGPLAKPSLAVTTGPAPIEQPSDPNVAARIRELEERLDRMIVAHSRERYTTDEELGIRPSMPPEPPAARSEPPPHVPALTRLASTARAFVHLAPPASEGVMGTARELLSSEFYLRKWGRLGLRHRSEEVDEFGYDPTYEQKVLPVFNFLYEKYFRVQTHGVERIPSEGRCLLVANHSGTVPVDGMMLRLAVRREHAARRDVRWLAEDAIFHFPFLGSFSNRIGAVRACQENAERLLHHGALVAVFPEGMKGIGKLFRDRYKLQRFGRGGFVKLCLRTRTPVVPVAIIGSEETNPMLARVEYLARELGVPYLPVTPTFPLLGPLGLLPAPTKWKMFFGTPIDFQSYGAESAEDEILVGRLAERVRGEIQSMLDRALAERRSVWFG